MQPYVGSQAQESLAFHARYPVTRLNLQARELASVFVEKCGREEYTKVIKSSTVLGNFPLKIKISTVSNPAGHSGLQST
jgi:hypothetical protein